MALATTCPQCKTSFKVVPDQLKLRRGLVRCGVCQHVFSGIDHLRYVDDAARAAQRAARERAASPGDAAGTPQTVGSSGSGTPGPAPGDANAARAAAPQVAPVASVGTLPGPVRAAEPEASPARAADRPNDASPDRAPADPWAAAAAIAHERSLRDDAPDRTTVSATTAAFPQEAPPRDALAGLPLGAGPGTATLAAGGSVPTPPLADAPPTAPSSAFAPATPGAPPAPPPPSSDAPTAPGMSTAPRAAPSLSSPPATVQAAAPHPQRPALPAPDGARMPLDDLLARPAAPWPPAAGPQTILAADENLKTAFFLTDSSFGPLPGEASDVTPPTSIHRPGAHAETVTRVRGEAPTPAAAPAPDASRARAPAIPGLPLRPERGAPKDEIVATPAFVPVPPPPFEPAPRRADSPPAEPAIDYFPGPRRRSRGLGLALSPTAWAAAVGLSVLLVLQAVVGWRDAIAARAPLFAPTLAGLLGPFGLDVRPPREIDALTIEGFELQASGTPNVLALSAVLRNRSAHVVGYPAMELTLTDSAGALIVRKVIPPDLYVGDATTIEAGLAARTERPVRLALQHDGLQPTGFAVALFYP
ncbi:MAG: zinc-ribbon domain-containing protein [Burkholderiales bacterium]|nr:zinc-ribbon domain-containing protein [Burkholderiales bacterium]